MADDDGCFMLSRHKILGTSLLVISFTFDLMQTPNLNKAPLDS